MSDAIRRFGWALPAIGAAVFVGGLSQTQVLPSYFAQSDALIWGAGTLLLALGLGLMLPETWLYSDAARLAHAFKEHHGVSGDRAEVALGAVGNAHSAAERLRAADTGFREDLSGQVALTADRLDEVARIIFYKPDQLPKYQALIIRAESVVDAIEDHGRLKAKAGSGDEVSASRGLALDGLESLQSALDASKSKEVAAILNRIEANVATAETLLRPRA